MFAGRASGGEVSPILSWSCFKVRQMDEDIRWHINDDWNNLDPEIGDLVLCSFSDGFDYSVKFIVTELSDLDWKGVVEGVFDLSEKGMIIHHSLQGQIMFLPRNVIQEVVKKRKR